MTSSRKTPAVGAPPPAGKLGILVQLLRRKQGATLFEMAAATGWQVHSVRGAMAGKIKRQLGLEIVSDKPGNERVYRIAPPARTKP